MATNTGNGSRIGSVKDRTQTYNPSNIHTLSVALMEDLWMLNQTAHRSRA